LRARAPPVLNEYESFEQAERSIAHWIEEYNHDRPHRGLHGQTPHEHRAVFVQTITFKHGPMCLVLRGALQDPSRLPFGISGKDLKIMLAGPSARPRKFRRRNNLW
jgi:hypothetical protein